MNIPESFAEVSRNALGKSHADLIHAMYKDAPQATITALPYVESDEAYLQALCAALPFSGVAKAWEPLTFEMRLEAAKVNADAILRAVAERNQAPTFLDGIAELQDLIKDGERGGA